MSEQLNQTIDPAIIERLQKLLRLARDGGATEGEANTAMSMAQKIALANNLSIASIELEGGASGEEGKRVKDEASGQGKRSWAQFKWQQDLMFEIARVNFCHCSLKWGKKEWTEGRGKVRPIGYNIIGRQANVVAAKEMFTYLITTINRLLLEHNHNDPRQNMSKYSNSWKEGCADRLRERLTERHEQNLKEQAAEARERKARASHSASAPTSNALVVVMTDYAQDEADLNTDMRFGQKPGTTKADRLRAVALREAEKEEKRKRIEEARAAGASERVLIAMETFSYTREEAELFIDKVDNPPEDKRTEKQKARDEERERKRDERWSRQYWREQARQANRLDSRGYAAGQKAGDNIGLDKQVKSNPAKRID